MKVSIKNNRIIPELLAGHFSRRFRKAHAEYTPFPSHLDIEVTNACNLRCIMCPREQMCRKIQHMDESLFEKIGRELGQNINHLDRVSLHLYGEPLLHPGIFRMVTALKEFGVPHVEFSTNCTLLDAERAEALIRSGLDEVIFAIDGATQETYSRVRVSGEFSSIVENVKQFFLIRERMGVSRPRVRLQIIVMSETQSEIKQFKAGWKPFLKDGDSFYIKRLSFNEFNRELVCDKRIGATFRVPCSLFPYTNMTILADGKVTVCCYDWNAEVVVGNASEQSLTEIWHSTAMKSFCKAHHDVDFSKYALCDRCEWTTKHCELEPTRFWGYLTSLIKGNKS